MNLVLNNGSIRIEIEREHGCIVRFAHVGLAIELVQEPRLAENFRLLVPLPEWRGHYIFGKEQALADAQADGTTCRLVWRGLRSSQGQFEIEVAQTIRLDGDDVHINTAVQNNSAHEVEEVFNFALGGMANDAERNDWQLHWGNIVGKGEERIFFDEFNSSYLGPANPVWFAVYPGQLAMTWVDLYHAHDRKGVYIGNHDPEVRISAFWTQLNPCTTYGEHGQHWPDKRATGDTPIGLTMAWNNFPFIKPGQSWQGPPIQFHFHTGTWWAAADYYRSWFDTQVEIDKAGSWMSEADAWQSTIISYPEGTVGYRFTDLPRVARDAKAIGIQVLQIDGWDIGGIDRDYPHYTPDPRLGTWNELEHAIAECREIGVYVMLFTNLQWINIETDWYKQELHQYEVQDPFGHHRSGMGWEYNTTLGLLNQTIYRMVMANPAHPRFRRIILDQLQNVVKLKAHGTQIDKLHVAAEVDYSPTNPAPRDSSVTRSVVDTVAAFYHQARASDPDFRIAAEALWDRVVPYVDASYSRFFEVDHRPTFTHTFPEFKASCCITGNWDFGLVNNCLRFGHIINVEARCLHGTAADVPLLGRYVAEALRVRRTLWNVLWHSTVVEPIDIEIQFEPALLFCLHQSWQGDQRALVLNHFQTTVMNANITQLGNANNAMVYRPFMEPEPITLPAMLKVPPDEFCILVFD